MDTTAITVTFVVGVVVAVIAFAAHRRLAGSGEGRPGLVSMLAFVLGWLAVLLALITGMFLVFSRHG